jgi:hypothetical protein
MNRIQTVVPVVAVLLLSVLACGDGGAQAEEPLVAPPPRCAELEEKMLECAREATGLEQLPASVAAGVEQAASLNCRRMRSASRDPELPTRVVAACSGEPCGAFPTCVSREAGPDVLLAAREADHPAGRGGSEGPPDLRELVGEGDPIGEASAGAAAAEPTSKSAEELCEPFVDKLLGCAAEQAGGALGRGEADGAARAFLEGCSYLVELPEAQLAAAFAGCTDAPCDAYGECVAEALAAAEPAD